jgi:hypothetical protein
MKKLITMITGMLFVSVMAVQAQSRDTVRHKNKDQNRAEHKYDRDKNKTTSGTQGRGYDKDKTNSRSTQGQANANMRDRKKVMVKDVPASLRQTLQGPEYKGWDANTSTIYTDRDGGYTVEIRNGNGNGNGNGNAKVYHFDKDGNRVDARSNRE